MRWPPQRRFPLCEMIELMVAQSDNTAVETLFRIGAKALPWRRDSGNRMFDPCAWIAVSAAAIWIEME